MYNEKLHFQICVCKQRLWILASMWQLKQLFSLCQTVTPLNYFNGNFIDFGLVCLLAAGLIIFTAAASLVQTLDLTAQHAEQIMA